MLGVVFGVSEAETNCKILVAAFIAVCACLSVGGVAVGPPGIPLGYRVGM